MLGYISPIKNYIEELFDQAIFISQYIKLGFGSFDPFLL